MQVSRRGFFGALAGLATFGLWKRPIEPLWAMRYVPSSWVTREVSVASTMTMRIPTRVFRG